METTKNKNQIKIGNVVIKSRVSLAPLAGITDFVLRQLIREYSSTCLLTTEMLSSEALVQRPDANIAYTNGKEEPAAFQIEGHKPELMAKSAKISKQNVWIPIVSALLIWLMGVSPVYIIAIAGIGGFIYGKINE